MKYTEDRWREMAHEYLRNLSQGKGIFINEASIRHLVNWGLTFYQEGVLDSAGVCCPACQEKVNKIKEAP